MADTEPAPASPATDADERVVEEIEVEEAAERRLVHQALLGAAIAVPIGVVVSVIVVFFAARIAGVAAGTPELMAVFVGVLFGLFFGALSGFVRNSGALDELDLHAGEHRVAHPA